MNTPSPSTFSRILKYVLVRSAWLLAMVAIGMFTTVVVINYGGYIDEMVRSDIADALNFVSLSGAFDGMTQEEMHAEYERMRLQMETAAGLNEPFLLRCARWTSRALQLDLGYSWRYSTLNTRADVRNTVAQVIKEMLPRTLLLAGSTNLLVFIISIFTALRLARRYGSWIDKLLVGLSPISATPNWIYGILLIVIVGGTLHWLPMGGMYDKYPPSHPLGYVWIIGKHMILPSLAIFLSAFFQSVYAWRTFYLMHIEDDHVEMARAKGVPAGQLERNYIVRPTLPYLVTSFALMLISFWQGVIVLEMVFNWPGIAGAFLGALRANDRNMVMGILVSFAYLLALTVFLLDIFYALVDPKVRITGESQTARPVDERKYLISINLFRLRRPPGLPGETNLAPGTPTRKRFALPTFTWPQLPSLSELWGKVKVGLRQITAYPSATLGLVMIAILAVVALGTVIAIPQARASYLWSASLEEWAYNPRNAEPAWLNWFRKEKRPPTIILGTRQGRATKEIKVITPEMTEINLAFAFDYQYNEFPQDVVLNLQAEFDEKRPHLIMTWFRPDGTFTEIYTGSMTEQLLYYIDEDQKLAKTLGPHPVQMLMKSNDTNELLPAKGRHIFQVQAYVFEPKADLDGELVVYGKVSGVAGTDDRRRDIGLALLWGAPVALAFGMFGAVITSFATMLLAAIGVWFGGWVDQLIQRLTEINMLLPALPIGIMVYFLYSKSIWAILGVIVLLNIFGSALKNFRAVFIQVKETPYIEAAQSYGAGDWRIIRTYMLPRILPVLIPQIVVLAPGYIFLEASLAYMGVSDPFLPTWGKVIFDAITRGAFAGDYYWVLEPVVLLMLTGLSFALVGSALEKVFNPRLRTR